MKKLVLLLFICISAIGISKLSAIESSPQFIQGTDTLVVYKNVPGLAPSDKYTIRVRSAATNNEWVDVFVNVTKNRAVPGSTTDINTPDKYQMNCAGWSHAYGNIEMNTGQVVEVEIAGKPGFTIAGKDFFKAKVHPSQKASEATMVGNKIYFTLTKPAQIYIDINGQMDDYNKAINPIGHPVEVVMLFANPVIKKPTLTGTRVRTIEPGTDLVTINAIEPATYDTMYFKPGLHDIASGIKMHPGKAVYIPGDAYIFGSFTNKGVPAGSFSKNGENISVFGYGTICGVKIPHYQVDAATRALLYPNVVVNGDKPISIENGLYFKLQGVTLADNANHSVEINGSYSSTKWVKTISWRVNGDGLGSNFEDCFVRSQDDASYTRGNIRRSTFWKDSNAHLFLMSYIPEDRKFVIEDCDVLYARLRTNPGNNGAGFTHHATGTLGQRKVNAVYRNIRIHDKLTSMRVFHLESGANGGSYAGLLFQNISIAGIAPGQRINTIKGTAVSPWYGGVIFDNVTIGGTLLSDQNFSSFFEINEFVKNIWCRMPNYYKITKNVNPTQGTVTLTTNEYSHFGVRDSDSTYMESSKVTLKATALPGYDFTGWSGDTITIANPLSIIMNSHKTITANFVYVGMKTLTLKAGANGSVANNPIGTSHSYNSKVEIIGKPAIGYQFDGWTGDFTSKSIVDSVQMNTDKTVTANFVKTNSFAVNYGGDQHISADGTVYAKGEGNYTRYNKITGTNDTILYQSEKNGKLFSLDYPVDNGEYTVTLKFVDLSVTVIDKRIFNVAIEGTPVLTNFDIFAEVGQNKVTDKTFQVTVADGVLNVGFTAIKDNAKISAIRITKGLPVSLTSTAGGKVSGSGGFPAGQSVTVTATPNQGCYFENWKDKNGAVVSTEAVYTFNLSTPVELQANFGKYVNVTIPTPIGGTITGVGSYRSGQSVTVKATPNAGYKFQNWTINSVFVTGYSSYTFTATNSVELQANFVLISGIEELNNTNISIYPNPVTDKLYFNSANQLIDKIELVDLTGKIIYATNVQVQNGSVDLKGMAKGMYLVKIHADNSIVTKKISIK